MSDRYTIDDARAVHEAFTGQCMEMNEARLTTALGVALARCTELEAALLAVNAERGELREAALTLSRAARPLSNFSFNAGQHRPDWERTSSDVKAFDIADNTVHSLLARAALDQTDNLGE